MQQSSKHTETEQIDPALMKLMRQPCTNIGPPASCNALQKGISGFKQNSLAITNYNQPQHKLSYSKYIGMANTGGGGLRILKPVP